MARINLNEDDSVYFDVLKELGNIGCGNATTALAHMLNRKVDMSVPHVRLLDFKEVGSILGGEEQIMAGVYLMVEGEDEDGIPAVQLKSRFDKAIDLLCLKDTVRTGFWTPKQEKSKLILYRKDMEL